MNDSYGPCTRTVRGLKPSCPATDTTTVYGAAPIRSHASTIAAIALTSFACLVAAPAALAAPAGSETGRAARAKATDPFAWTTQPRSWAASQGMLPAGVLARGPQARISRGHFLSALLKLQKLRGERTHALLRSSRPAPALADVPAGSAAARAVANGWMPARAGRFAGGSAITADEAAIAITAALGLRPAVNQLALRLRTELPGQRIRTTYAAAHALSRTLGLRYNVKDPNDRFELGPRDALDVAHGTYMLHVAATVDGWRLDEATELAMSFDLPDLGPNQLRVLGTGARLLGQPYVWAGETEGSQPEGKGGFDCSGFAIRIINASGVPEGELARVAERTTYTQSAIPTKQRIAQAALQPGDLMFFGSRATKSTPTQNYHAGVYMGNGWFIHSSGGNGGVAIDALDGWWGDEFSWGRRTLLAP